MNLLQMSCVITWAQKKISLQPKSFGQGLDELFEATNLTFEAVWFQIESPHIITNEFVRRLYV